VLLVLKLCCVKNVGASTLKLQLLAWTLRDDVGRKSLMKAVKIKDRKYNFNFWALDPALNRAIEFALADGFLILKNEKFIPSPKGETLLSYVLEHDVFIFEKEILEQFGKSVTESFVKTVLKNEHA